MGGENVRVTRALDGKGNGTEAARGVKTYTLGTHRVRPPADTLRAVQPLLARFGITRVANVTGLDRIGIPVWQAIRPNSRSLSVFQGKGVDGPAAKVSAIMESVEAWHAEFALPCVRMESHAALSRAVVTLDPETLPRQRGSRHHPGEIIPWVEGEDLLGGERVWIPAELVHAMFVVPEPPGSGGFFRSSNGLASGNTRSEALVHALAEVLERDGMALAAAMAPAALRRRRLDLATVDDPAAGPLLARLAKADMAVAVHDITTDVGVPIFRATILDRESDALLNPAAAARGSGCHPDPGVALCRALTEAAQSRLTAIAGARDDLSRADYRRIQSARVLALNRRAVVEGAPGRARFGDVPRCATATVDGDLAAMLGRLRRIGVARTVAVDLAEPGLPFAVVRVVVPGLEGLGHLTGARVGRPMAGRRGKRRA